MKHVTYTVKIEFSAAVVSQHYYKKSLPACISTLLEDSAYFDDIAEIENITIKNKFN